MTMPPASVQVIAKRATEADRLYSSDAAGDRANAIVMAMSVCRQDVPELMESLRYHMAQSAILRGRVAAMERQIAELRSGKDATATFARGESHG